MNVIEFRPERRRRRSSNMAEAIKFQLEHIVDRRALRNFVLGDSCGMLIGHAGHSEESEILAAYAPVLSGCTDRERRRELFERLRAFIPDVCEETFQIRTFQVDGETLHLAVLGEAGCAQTDLYRATSGIRRILGEIERAA